jgi:hypothetical protein
MKVLRKQSQMEENAYLLSNVPVMKDLTSDECREWLEIKTPSSVLSRRSHHSSVIYNNYLYVYGGYENGSTGGLLNDFKMLNLENYKWQDVKVANK